jgi:hypothetical protein
MLTPSRASSNSSPFAGQRYRPPDAWTDGPGGGTEGRVPTNDSAMPGGVRPRVHPHPGRLNPTPTHTRNGVGLLFPGSRPPCLHIRARPDGKLPRPCCIEATGCDAEAVGLEGRPLSRAGVPFMPFKVNASRRHPAVLNPTDSKSRLSLWTPVWWKSSSGPLLGDSRSGGKMVSPVA